VPSSKIGLIADVQRAVRESSVFRTPVRQLSIARTTTLISVTWPVTLGSARNRRWLGKIRLHRRFQAAKSTLSLAFKLSFCLLLHHSYF
jgi:hypothetical protein